jgi:hypothetical protein
MPFEPITTRAQLDALAAECFEETFAAIFGKAH